jgi:hypothetical protein
VLANAFNTESEEHPQNHANLRGNLPLNISYLRVYIENAPERTIHMSPNGGETSLRNLAQDCRADCPHLKAILVSDKCTGVLPIDEDIRKLKAQFRKQGVSLLIKGEHLVTPIPAVQEWKRLTADCDIVLNGMGRKSKMHTLHIYDSHNNDCLLHNRHGSYPGLWQEIRVGGRASAMGSG